MPQLEELSFRHSGDILFAAVEGEIDLSNAATVEERILEAVPNTASALVVDLTHTEYLDSSGVHLIFELAERLRSRGQRLELVVPDNSLIRRVLVLTEVPRVVPMSSTADGAGLS
jgi:anti-anti-sigma factor